MTGEVGGGLGNSERGSFACRERTVVAPPCQRVELRLRDACRSSTVAMHGETEAAAVELRDAHLDEAPQTALERALCDLATHGENGLVNVRAQRVGIEPQGDP